MNLLTVFLLFYAIAFALLAFLPRWWLLAIGGVVAFLLSHWAMRDVMNADGPGVMFAIPMVGLAELGFLSGGLARAALLTTRRRANPGRRTAIVLPLFFFGAPTVVWGWSAYVMRQDARRLAPPAAACSRASHPASLAGVSLTIPLAPSLSVGTGREYQPSYWFNINEHMRRFCAEDTPQGVALTNLYLNFERHDHYGPGVAPSIYCGAGHEAWRATICGAPSPDPIALQRVVVYAIGDYNAGKMHAFSADEAPMLLAQAARYAARPLGVGTDAHDDGKGQVYLTRRDDPRFAARCFRTTGSGKPLYCDVGERLSPKIGLIYGFVTADADAAATMTAARRDARAIWDSFERR